MYWVLSEIQVKMYKQYRLKCETYFQCKKKSFTWKLFMECNKAQWFGENNSLQKSFKRSLARELFSRIWDKYFKADKILENFDILKKWCFFSFISPSTSCNSPNRSLYLCLCTHNYTHDFEEMELLSFLLSYCHLLFFSSLCLWELVFFFLVLSDY